MTGRAVHPDARVVALIHDEADLLRNCAKHARELADFYDRAAEGRVALEDVEAHTREVLGTMLQAARLVSADVEKQHASRHEG